MANGKIQFLSCKDDVIRLINEGYTYKQIYTMMLNNGKFSMVYNTFCLLVKKYGISKMPERSFASMTADIRYEITNKIENYKKYGIRNISEPVNAGVAISSNFAIQNSKQQQTKIQPIPQVPQSSPQKKPTFELIRLGDEAFE